MSYGRELLDDYAYERYNNRMDSKRKHPFAITCRKCGSNSVNVIAYEYRDLGIKCKRCGSFVSCGIYDTESGDYSE